MDVVMLVSFIVISLLIGILGYLVSWGYQLIIPCLLPKLLFKIKAWAEIYEDAIDQGFMPNYNWKDNIKLVLANIIGYNAMANGLIISGISICYIHSLICREFDKYVVFSIILGVIFSGILIHIRNYD